MALNNDGPHPQPTTWTSPRRTSDALEPSSSSAELLACRSTASLCAVRREKVGLAGFACLRTLPTTNSSLVPRFP